MTEETITFNQQIENVLQLMRSSLARLPESNEVPYGFFLETFLQAMSEKKYGIADAAIRGAFATAPQRPEAWYFRGILMEIQGEQNEALMNFRAALALDPGFEPAQQLLYRSEKWF